MIPVANEKLHSIGPQGPQDKVGMVRFTRCRLPWTGSDLSHWEERFPVPQTLLQVACINLMLQSTADVNAKDCITTYSDLSCTYDLDIFMIFLPWIFMEITKLRGQEQIKRPHGCTLWKHLELCSLGSGKAWLHTVDVCRLISKVRCTVCEEIQFESRFNTISHRRKTGAFFRVKYAISDFSFSGFLCHEFRDFRVFGQVVFG